MRPIHRICVGDNARTSLQALQQFVAIRLILGGHQDRDLVERATSDSFATRRGRSTPKTVCLDHSISLFNKLLGCIAGTSPRQPLQPCEDRQSPDPCWRPPEIRTLASGPWECCTW